MVLVIGDLNGPLDLNRILKDCIRNTTAVCNPRQNPRQNSVRDKFSLRQIQSETKFSPRQNSVQTFFFPNHWKKILKLNFVLYYILSQTEFVSD